MRKVKIPATLQPLIDVNRMGPSPLLKQLQVGQILQARVLAQLQPGLIRIQIATTELLARSPVALKAGTRLELEVVKGQPLPELRILREPTPPERQQQTVRAAIARQLPPSDIRQALGELRTQTQTPGQSEAVRKFATILQDAGVRLDQLNAGRVQRAVSQSGLFHEARLAGALPLEPADTKTQLLKLLAVLSSEAAPPEKGLRSTALAPEQAAAARNSGGDSLLNRLVRLIEASVSRVQLQQAAALPTEEGPRQAWQLDLPIQLPGETHEAMLRIERETAGKEDKGSATWAVNLAFEFDTIGTLQTRITLAGERVSATFWCDRDNTRQIVEQRLPGLKEALEAQGLEVVHLAGVRGEPPQPLIRIPIPDTLLDEHA